MCKLLPCTVVCRPVRSDRPQRAECGAEDGRSLRWAKLDSRADLVQPFPQLREHLGVHAARDASAERDVDFFLGQVEPYEAGADERGDLVEQTADDPGRDRVALRFRKDERGELEHATAREVAD